MTVTSDVIVTRGRRYRVLRIPLVLTVICASLAVAAPQLSPSVSAGAFPGSNGHILYLSADDRSIHLVDVDGTNDQVILDGTGYGNLDSLAVSPDGTQLVFSATTIGSNDFDVYKSDIDGTDVVRLTTSPPTSTSSSNRDFMPTWSPDGLTIYFVTSRSNARFEIFRMNADGSGQARVGAAVDRGSPSVSPDGSKILFTQWASTSSSSTEIYVMSKFGGGVTRLTTRSGVEISPSWSPDGTKVLFTDSTGTTAWVMNADGTSLSMLVDPGSPYRDQAAAWSPDGTRIAVTRNDSNGLTEVYVLNADGSNPVRLEGIRAGTIAWVTVSASISGHVGYSNDDSGPTEVTAYGAGIERRAITRPDGSYRIIGLVPGQYTVRFSSLSFNSEPQWYANQPAETPTPILISAVDEAVTGIDATLADVRNPTVVINSPTIDAIYTAGEVVVADYSCLPGSFPISLCEGAIVDTGSNLIAFVASGATLDTSTPGDYVFEVNTCDVPERGCFGEGFPYTVVPVSDATPPVITPVVTGTLGQGGWFTSGVQVQWTVVDGESTVTSLQGCGATTLSADTAGTTLTCTAQSAGGAATASTTVKIDATAPTVTISSPVDGAQFVVGAVVLAEYSCADGVQLVSCDSSQLSGSPLDTAVPSLRALDVTATDAAGNTATLRSLFRIVDVTAPTATIAAPVDGATYPLLTSETAAYACTDDVLVASCVGPVPVGSALPANVPGSMPFTVSANDSSNLNTTVTATYTVSNTFAPNLGLTGSFTSIPTSVSVADEPAPAGVTVFVPGGGTAPVAMSVCGGFTVELVQGTAATLTCGSVLVSVMSGQVKVTTPDAAASMTVPSGGTARLGADGVPVNLGTTPITFVGPMTRIAISPAVAVVGTGVNQVFTVEGFDAYGQSLGDKTAAATFTITPSATCTANSCRATTVGVRTVTATVGSLTSTALLDVRKAQTIKFAAPTTKVMTQSPVALSATATSGLVVSFVSTTPAVCTTTGPNGASVVLAGAGMCSITAQQPGDATWAPAPNLVRTFTVNKASQTITFASLPARTIDQSPFTVTATSSSGLGVVFSTSTPSVCTATGPDGASIVLLDSGTCTVRADQAGNIVYAAATPVSRSFTVSKLANSITFASITKKTLAESPVNVTATSSSGLPVTFTSTTTAVCATGGVDGASITLVAAGTCTIRADQAGDGTYKAANPVNRSFTVTRVAQTITFAALSNTTLAQSPVIVTANASSGLPVQFSTTTPLICTAGGTNGSVITLLAPGTCTVRADQPGDSYWAAATSVNRNFKVT